MWLTITSVIASNFCNQIYIVNQNSLHSTKELITKSLHHEVINILWHWRPSSPHSWEIKLSPQWFFQPTLVIVQALQDHLLKAISHASIRSCGAFKVATTFFIRHFFHCWFAYAASLIQIRLCTNYHYWRSLQVYLVKQTLHIVEW